ncbi:MAG TPA: hypothetical protein VK816_06660 [Jatrophihabitantaceae bacterium]|nr:hypothetical protein [Jatrophihabitantaceae bacterium]
MISRRGSGGRMRALANSPAEAREPIAAKVPEITVLFWVIKILTTGMGEATSDYLANTSLALAGVVGIFGFVFAMWLQFRTRRYVAVVYWFAVMMVAVFGTMAADGLHVGLGIPYLVTTVFYAVVLAVVLCLWRRSEGTLSIHSITTRRRETYYWLTVLATFALGTATGDLTATSMNLGFFSSGVIFAIVIAIPAVGWWRFGLNPIFAFWFAYVVTRPLGASFADWFGKAHSIGGGLGFGDGAVSACALVVIAALVGYVAVTRSDIQPVTDAPDGALVTAQGEPHAGTTAAGN